VSLPWLICPVRGVAPSMRPLAARGLAHSIADGDVSGGGGGVVGGEPAVQGGAAQPREGAGLGLLHGLARQPEAAADLLEGARGLPVEAVTGGKDGAVARGQAGEGGVHGGGEGVGLGRRVGPVGVRVGEEVAQGRGLAVAHDLIERDGGGQGRDEGVHAGAGETRRGGQVGGGGRMAQGGVQGVGLAGEAGTLHLHVVGDVGDENLPGEGAPKGLFDPPDGVGGELVAARGVEEVNGAQEADGALLHEVVEGEAALLVAPGDGDDEALIGGGEGGAGRVTGAEGVLVEGPGDQGGAQARAGVVV